MIAKTHSLQKMKRLLNLAISSFLKDFKLVELYMNFMQQFTKLTSTFLC